MNFLFIKNISVGFFMSLDSIFKPKSVAVIGASAEKGSVGYGLFRNILKSDYQGKVFAVNYKRKKVQGEIAYQNILQVPARIDLAVIATPAATVPRVMEECGQAGVGGVVVISAGFNEAGEKGVEMSRQIVEIARRYKMRVIGPNCLGFLRPSIGLNASFAASGAKPGKIALVSQSGALCTSILDWAKRDNIGFSYFVSIGSMIETGFHDLLEYFGKDKETEAILIYMESLTDAAAFLASARRISPRKPIFVLKSGRSAAGAHAAQSHTGSLAGDDAVFSAAFASAGIVRVDNMADLFGCAKILGDGKTSDDNNLTIITNAGGPGVISTDALMNGGGNMPAINSALRKKLDTFLPAAWSHNNPIDILGDADGDRYEQAVRACVEDVKIKSLLILLTPQAMTNPADVARRIVKISGIDKKMVLASFLGGPAVVEAVKILSENGIPAFAYPEEAIRSFVYTAKCQKKKMDRVEIKMVEIGKVKKERNRKIIDSLRAEDRKIMTEREAKDFLLNYGIDSLRGGIAASSAEAADIFDKIGRPVAMKILSPDIMHKIDVGGVILDVDSREKATVAFSKIVSSVKAKAPQARIQGVLMEEMAGKGFELLIGCHKDPIFGHSIAFGTGGTAVEVYRDVNLGIAPLNMTSVQNLVQGTKVFKLLSGFRGQAGVDLSYLYGVISRLSMLVEDFPEIKELDMNPFVINSARGVVLDAKIVIE